MASASRSASALITQARAALANLSAHPAPAASGDAFLGSGTTVMAAERTGRRCYGLELDPAYVDTIVRRWQALIGGSARHAASGRSFDDLAREAEVANAA
jgi:DNA methylase